MNAHSIRHAWFPPSIPKRKLERELDAESEWPSAYHALSGPALEPRPAKRLKALEGELAGLTLDVRAAAAARDPRPPVPPASPPTTAAAAEVHNQIHDAPLEGDAEPYISSIYEWASPHTAVGSSVTSLPLRGEVSEVNTSDEDEVPMIQDERMGDGITVEESSSGVPGYTFYEPKPAEGETRTKRKWYEPEKDRIVILDLDSSEDESVARSPRRRRSAFSLSESSNHSSGRPRSQTDAPPPEYVINSTLLSHITPPVPPITIPREEDPAKAIVLFRPITWTRDEESNSPTSPAVGVEDLETGLGMDASPLDQEKDEDAMDIDS